MRHIVCTLACIAALAVGVPPVGAANQACEHSRLVIAPCYWVHGRLYPGAGTPGVRITITGTRRIIGVFNFAKDPEGAALIPRAVGAVLDRGEPLRTEVEGDYRVCPFTKERKGWMRFACIADTRDLKARRL